MVNQFAFCPEKVDGFYRVPEHLEDEWLVPDTTVVCFAGYKAEVADSDGELFRFLVKYRELQSAGIDSPQR